MRAFPVLPILLALVAGAAAAQAPAEGEPVRLRGQVTAVEAGRLTVKTRDGATATVATDPGWTVGLLTPVPMDAIKTGVVVGIAEVERGDGVGRALEVDIQGPGVQFRPGRIPWDLAPGSMITTGDVESSAAGAAAGEREYTLKLPDGARRRLVVGPATPVVVNTVGEAAMVKPGTNVFIVGRRARDGALSTARVLVGADGSVPPM
jgi:hypothetical protein